MIRLSRLIIIVLALFMLAGCDDVGPGSGGSGDEVGVSEDADGTFYWACLKITHTVKGDEVMVRLYINDRFIAYQIMSPQLTQWPFEYRYNNYAVQGSITYTPRPAWGPAELYAMDGISLECNGQTTRYSGNIAAWD